MKEVEVSEQLQKDISWNAGGNPAWVSEIIKVAAELDQVINEGDINSVTSVMIAKQVRVFSHTLTNPEASWKFLYSPDIISVLRSIAFFSVKHVFLRKILRLYNRSLFLQSEFDLSCFFDRISEIINLNKKLYCFE